jgi:hypothetical protein
MSKELPYFRFTAHEWLNDDISLEDYILKGVFIDVCAYYWSQDCSTTLAKLKKRFSNATSYIDDLIKIDVLKHENRYDKVEIVFLNLQYDLLSEKRKSAQDRGSKGGKAKAKLKLNPAYKDKDKNKDKNKEKYNFRQSLLNFGFLENLVNDWLVIRKNKKASNTETAFNGFIKELNKTGLDKNEVLKTCVERSWAGLNSEWLKKEDKKSKIDDTAGNNAAESVINKIHESIIK